MKLKRTLSLVISIAMLISLIPAFSASAESAEELTYEFSTAHFSNLSDKPNFTEVVGKTASGGALYTPLGYSSYNSTLLSADNFKFVAPSSSKGVMLFAIDIPEAGTYIPSVEFTRAARGGYLYTYVFDAATAANVGISTEALNEDNNALISSLSGLTALDNTYIDTESNAGANTTHTFTNGINFSEKGTYYLAFAVNSGNAAALAACGKKTGMVMFFVNSFTLTKSAGGGDGDGETGEGGDSGEGGNDEPVGEPVDYTYVFTTTAKGIEQGNIENATTDTAIGTAPWWFVQGYKLSSRTIYADGYRMNDNQSYAYNGTLLKITVDKTATYTPSVAYAKHNMAGNFRVFLVSESEAEQLGLGLVYNANNGTDIKKILDGATPLGNASIDGYSETATSEWAETDTHTFESLDLTAGTYYLMFSVNDASDAQKRAYIRNFRLKEYTGSEGGEGGESGEGGEGGEDEEIGDISNATDVYINFDEPTCAPTDVKIDEYGWCINTSKSHSSSTNATITAGTGLYSKTKYSASTRLKLAIDVYVPNDGIYQPKLFSSYSGSNARLTNIYCDELFIGQHDYGSSGVKFSSFRTLYLKKGVHTFYFESLTPGKNNKYYHTLYKLCLIAQPDFTHPIEISTADNSYHLAPGSEAALNAKALMSDFIYFSGEKTFSGKNDPYITLSYKSADDSVAAVSDNGVITAKADGNTTVTVTATSNNISVTKEIPVLVDGNGESSTLGQVIISANSFVTSLDSDGIQLTAHGKSASGNTNINLTNASITWESLDEDIITVDENGFAKPVALGSAEIKVTVSLDGAEASAGAFVSVREGKTGRSFYTDKKVAAARENITKYSWAKDEKAAAVQAAEKYLGLEETLWNLIPGQEIPRSTSVGYKTDPDMHYCRYCGDYLYDKYGRWGYDVDPLTNPWKIQCKSCKRLFPSNDFASFYELGLDEHGVFSRELALERNAELVANGEDGYLVNVLYPELYDPTKDSYNKDPRTGDPVDGKTWGVDDGMGYDTGRTYDSNNLSEVHTYISYYNHVGLWYMNGTGAPVVYDALESLANAYIFTGDAKYGRVGAILLDRVADYYPDYTIIPYLSPANNKGSSGIFYVSSGGNTAGKLVGSIWENFIADKLALAYDAFFPAYDDPYVVKFLSEKAAKYDFENTKETPELIRQNCEDGLLRAIFKGAQDAQIKGNFGFVQATVATTAVVLDTYPETQEMIDWIFAQSKSDGETYNMGGGVNTQLITFVSRDGQGNESAPGYNKIWITDLSDAASKLAEYEGYEGINLYEHPKYLRMIKSYPGLTVARRGVPPIGDSSSAANYSKLPNDDAVMINAFAQTGDIEIAQHFYKMSDSDFSTIHYDIFTENPESLRKDIEAVIEEHGEYNYDKSTMLTGYGFGALRSGTLYNSTGTNVIRDTQRDFWMYFGGAVSHANFDKLNLGIESYGIPFTTDLGYPEATGTNPNKHQWANTTLAHNAVVVNEKDQLLFDFNQQPLHFDATDTRVKVMDIDATPVYIETDEYRRTVVMVDYDSEVSYGIDFFKVSGGDDHIYSFHASSENDPIISENLSFVHQETGTYAGPDVPFGNDPWTNESSANVPLKYPKGYTWLYDIYKAENPGEKEFWFDYSIEDFRGFSRNGKQNYRMRITALNDFSADEVTLANAMPPRTTNNLSYIDHLEYMLIRRKGKNLTSLFTTVIEPYNGNRYIESIENVEITVDASSAVQPGENDSAKAIKVQLIDGRTDYIVYAQNNQVTYNVGDVFKFKGFVGVWTVNSEGVNTYNYVNDGEMIGTDEKLIDNLDAEITGTIVNFQKELSFDNWLEVELDRELTADEATTLSGRLLNISNPTKRGNSSFVIEGVTMKSPTVALIDLGEITLIDGFVDPDEETLGYSYDAEIGRKVTIPMSYEENDLPVFDEVSDDLTTSAGSSVSVTVNATPKSGNISYSARTLPRGASFDAETGTVTWKPTASQLGENLFAIDATDSDGRQATVYFTVTVYGSTTGGGSSSGNTTGAGTGSSTGAGTGSAGGSSGGAGGGGSAGGTGGSGSGTTTPSGDDKPSTTPDTGTTGSEDNTSSARFVDLGAHAWAAEAINALADEEIIKGTSEDTFSPAANITRADFALLLVRAFKLTSENSENFADVTESDYFANELAIARNTGLVNGIGDNKFAPRNTITRQDMMTIVYRALQALEVELGTGDVEYPDFASVADYAKDSVKALIASGLVNGKGGKIAPTDNTTRAEVAVLIKRILDYTQK